MKIKNKKFTFLYVILAFTLAITSVPSAFAAGLTSISDSVSSLDTSASVNHLIVFTTPTGVTAGQSITLTFPAGFTLTGVVYGDMDMQDNGSDLTLGALPATATWGATVSGQVVTIVSGTGAISSGHTITIKIGTNASFGGVGTHQIANPSSASTYIVSIGGTMADTGQYALPITAAGADTVPVNATVSPSISFTVVNTALALGTLSSSSVSSSGLNIVTIGTNAHSGYTISIKDTGDGTNPGLYASAISKLIASATASPLTVGSEGYGANCTKNSGSGTCTFADGTSNNVTGLTTSAATFASYGSKPAGTDSFNVRVKASISTSTDANSYADTLTLVGTANF